MGRTVLARLLLCVCGAALMAGVAVVLIARPAGAQGGSVSGSAFGLFSPSGTRFLAAFNEPRRLYLLDAETGKKQVELEGSGWLPDGRGQHGVFSPDGKRLLAVIGNTTVGVWDTTTDRLLLTLAGHVDQITDTRVSLQGTRIVTGAKPSHLVAGLRQGRADGLDVVENLVFGKVIRMADRQDRFVVKNNHSFETPHVSP